MTNKPMLSVERELLERALSAVIVARGPGSPTERDLRAILDKPAECRCKRYGKDNPHWPCPVHAEPASQHHGEPVVPIFAKGCTVLESGNGKYRIVTSYQNRIDAWADYEALCRAEQPAPVADQAQCEECKGWGYHENHHEGGGTECGECGGSGNATEAEVMVMPDRMKVEPFTTIDRGSKNYKAGYNAAIAEVASLKGVNK